MSTITPTRSTLGVCRRSALGVTQEFVAVAAFADSWWCGLQTKKLFIQSGTYTTTVKTSQSISAINNVPTGISWNGTDSPWCGIDGPSGTKLYLQSGQFTSTLKTSLDVNNLGFGQPTGISWDGGGDTLWSGREGVWPNPQKLWLQSGQFSSTVKTSQEVGGQFISPGDVSYDGTDTLWIHNKLYLQSGLFTSTIKTSVSIVFRDQQGSGISKKNNDVPWSGAEDDKLYLQAGFTTTMINSQDISTTDTSIQGTEYGSLSERLGI